MFSNLLGLLSKLELIISLPEGGLNSAILLFQLPPPTDRPTSPNCPPLPLVLLINKNLDDNHLPK